MNKIRDMIYVILDWIRAQQRRRGTSILEYLSRYFFGYRFTASGIVVLLAMGGALSAGSLSLARPVFQLGVALFMLFFAVSIAGWFNTLSCRGVDGSWGKLGFTTKLLATLKTVEIINLQAPSLRDKGLVYKSFVWEATFEEGVMTLSEVFLDGGAYAMNARGGIDFAAEECDIRVYTRVMESVSRMVKWVPLVGQVVEAGTKQVGVAVQMSGSPYDIQAEIVPRGGIAGTAVGAVAKGMKLLKNTVKKITPGAGEKESSEEIE